MTVTYRPGEMAGALVAAAWFDDDAEAEWSSRTRRHVRSAPVADGLRTRCRGCGRPVHASRCSTCKAERKHERAEALATGRHARRVVRQKAART